MADTDQDTLKNLARTRLSQPTSPTPKPKSNNAAKLPQARAAANSKNTSNPFAPTPKTAAEKQPSKVNTSASYKSKKPKGWDPQYKPSPAAKKYFETSNRNQRNLKGGIDSANAGFMPPFSGAGKEYTTDKNGNRSMTGTYGIEYDGGTAKPKKKNLIEKAPSWLFGQHKSKG